MITQRELSSLYQNAHDSMRNVDGLQPQEAFNELLKYLFFKAQNEKKGPNISSKSVLLADGSYGDDKKVVDIIRKKFKEYVASTNSWSKEVWHDQKFHLSDSALLSINSVFKNISISEISIDIKSAALRSFLTPEIRKGLGIFITPDDVVKAMVHCVQPKEGDRVLDPACGTGTFLIETIKYWNNRNKNVSKLEVWGIDKNPRMLLLADLNLNGYENCTFHKSLSDSLMTSDEQEWPKPNYFDIILTNPPFGVILDEKNYDLSKFTTCSGKKKQQSEVVFIEQCLKYLKPGGTLGIVLPKSVINNESLVDSRQAINKLGYVTAIAYLPPQTFQLAGTQTTTVVLFMRKFKENESRAEKIRIGLGSITNVGYDSTGRDIEGSQLNGFADNMRLTIKNKESTDNWKLLPEVNKDQSLIKLNDSIIEGNDDIDEKVGIHLVDIAEIVRTGQTPSRSSYSSHGLFVVKVGNLTGSGIDWAPRDRNFVDSVERERRKQTKRPLMLEKGDILLTSSAHSPLYIAQKVDIISEIPSMLNGEASFVGEVMLIRVKKKSIDPMALLVFLRQENTKRKIQGMVRGQTAHLHPSDLGKLIIPKSLLKPNNSVRKLIDLMSEENELANRKNQLFFEQERIMQELVF